MTHINPGTDTTINPVVIDDSYRERKKDPKGTQYDSGSGHGWTKIPPSAPSHPPEAQQRVDTFDTLKDLKTTAGLLYEFCEWFCDYDCEEKPCTVTVSRLQERLEGIKKQMEEHPEYLAKWNAKRAEQIALLQAGDPK